MKTLPPSTKPATPNPASAVTVVEISDPTAIGQNIEVIEQDAVQLESGPLRARRIVVRLSTSVLVYHSTNLPLRTRTRLLDGFVAFVAFGPQAAGTLNGLPVGPDRLLACMSGIEVEFVVAGGYESVCFLLPPDDIRSHLRGRHREDEFRLPNRVELLQPSLAAVCDVLFGTLRASLLRGCLPRLSFFAVFSMFLTLSAKRSCGKRSCGTSSAATMPEINWRW
jgi:hypothetical protein